ncbi:phage terminase small subunit P27 family [Oenococcus sp.]|uniref:phage terminase small subunit P27 family n=1 Tax=Oenococcus sp. TaxID=1979414 RepID=UPI0039E85B59
MAGTINSGRKAKLNNTTSTHVDRRKRAQKAQSNIAGFKDIGSSPSYFSKDMKTLWSFIVKELDKKGLIKQLDASLLEEYITQVDISKKAYQSIVTGGIILENGRKNPAVGIKSDAAKNIKVLGASLGLDPISRASMIGSIPEDKGSEAKKQNDVLAKLGVS